MKAINYDVVKETVSYIESFSFSAFMTNKTKVVYI